MAWKKLNFKFENHHYDTVEAFIAKTLGILVFYSRKIILNYFKQGLFFPVENSKRKIRVRLKNLLLFGACSKNVQGARTFGSECFMHTILPSNIFR